MICENLGINFQKLRKNMIEGYERNKNIPNLIISEINHTENAIGIVGYQFS